MIETGCATGYAELLPWRQRVLAIEDYSQTWEAMREFTLQRNGETRDEIWYLQHPPVYTQGLNGKPQHVLDRGTIPLLQVDRGGQVTYHGPGQLVVYLLLDIQRRKLGIRDVVTAIEQAVLDYLAEREIRAERRPGAPGIYVDGAKIAALGLRVKKGRTYHGLSLNINMELEPFARINPCGYAGMPVTQLADLLPGTPPDLSQVITDIHPHLARQLGYNNP